MKKEKRKRNKRRTRTRTRKITRRTKKRRKKRGKIKNERLFGSDVFVFLCFMFWLFINKNFVLLQFAEDPGNAVVKKCKQKLKLWLDWCYENSIPENYLWYVWLCKIFFGRVQSRTSHLPSDFWRICVLGSFKCNSPWENRNPHAPFLVAQLNLSCSQEIIVKLQMRHLGEVIYWYLLFFPVSIPSRLLFETEWDRAG